MLNCDGYQIQLTVVNFIVIRMDLFLLYAHNDGAMGYPGRPLNYKFLSVTTANVIILWASPKTQRLKITVTQYALIGFLKDFRPAQRLQT